MSIKLNSDNYHGYPSAMYCRHILPRGYQIPVVEIDINSPAAGCVTAIETIKMHLKKIGVKVQDLVATLNEHGFNLDKNVFSANRLYKMINNPKANISVRTIGNICFVAFLIAVDVRVVMQTPKGALQVMNREFDLWFIDQVRFDLLDAFVRNNRNEAPPDDKVRQYEYAAIIMDHALTAIEMSKLRKLGNPEGILGWDGQHLRLAGLLPKEEQMVADGVREEIPTENSDGGNSAE